jgi:hypothetical protein
VWRVHTHPFQAHPHPLHPNPPTKHFQKNTIKTGLVNFIDARTQWVDDGMRRALDDGVKQVVIIAAGFDTRAYRLARPGVTFFEIDLPHASAKKQELVEQLLPASKVCRGSGGGCCCLFCYVSVCRRAQSLTSPHPKPADVYEPIHTGPIPNKHSIRGRRSSAPTCRA